MIWIVFGLLVAGAVIGSVLVKMGGVDSDWLFLQVPCVILAFVVLIVLLIATAANSAGFVALNTFYQANSQNYEVAIDETASYLSEEGFKQVLVEGSIEKLALAGYVSERLREWRDAVNTYNTGIAKMKYWNSNIFLGVLYPNEVMSAKLLIMD